MAGGFLEGSTRDRPMLPLRGKATALIAHYGGMEISQAEFLHVQSPREWGSDDQLVIVFRRPPHDKALLVGLAEFRRLRADRGWLETEPAWRPRFVLMPRALALELAGVVRNPLRVPEGK